MAFMCQSKSASSLADLWNVTEASCTGRFPGASHGRFLPNVFNQFSCQLLRSFRPLPSSSLWSQRQTDRAGWTSGWQLGFLARTDPAWITLFSNHISLILNPLYGKCGCGEHGLSPFYEDHFPESVCIFVFFCSCPSFSHHSLSFFFNHRPLWETLILTVLHLDVLIIATEQMLEIEVWGWAT